MRLIMLVIAAVAGPAGAEVSFVSLDRASGHTLAGVHLGVLRYENAEREAGPLTFARLAVFAEGVVTPNVGLMFSFGGAKIGDEPREGGFTPMHLGGYYRYPLDNFELVGRVGLVIPLDTYLPHDARLDDVALHATLVPWLEERAEDAGAYWMHTGGSARFRACGFVAQFDALADVPLNHAYAHAAGSLVRVHLGGGVAYTVSRLRASAELLASGYMFDDAETDSDIVATEADVVFGLTLSGALNVGAGKDVVAWFSMPLDDYLRTYFHVFGAGYQSSL